MIRADSFAVMALSAGSMLVQMMLTLISACGKSCKMARWTARAPATQGGQVGESTARSRSLDLSPLKRSRSGCSEPANVIILDVLIYLVQSAWPCDDALV